MKNFDELDDLLITNIPSDTEKPVTTGSTTKRARPVQFPSNADLVNKVNAVTFLSKVENDIKNDNIKGVKTDVSMLQAVLPRDFVADYNLLNKKEETPLTKELMEVLLSELFIRFDTDPKFYLKEDYFALLKVLYKGLLSMYKLITYTSGNGIVISELKEISIDENIVASKAYVLQELSKLPHIPQLKKYDATYELMHDQTEGSELLDKIFIDLYNNDIVVLEVGVDKKRKFQVSEYHGQNADANFRAVSLVSASFKGDDPTQELIINYGILYCYKDEKQGIAPITYFKADKLSKSDIHSLELSVGDKLRKVMVANQNNLELINDLAISTTLSNEIIEDGDTTLVTQGYVDKLLAWEETNNN